MRQNDRLDKLIFPGFYSRFQQQRESIKCPRLDEHQNISLILVYFVNYSISSQLFLQGETREPHTKTIYSAWNTSKTNVGHLLDKRCQWWRGGAQKTSLSVKNYRIISHNRTTHTGKKPPHTAEAPTLAQGQLKPERFHPLQPPASAAGLKLIG